MTKSNRHKIYQAIEELHQEKEISLLCKITNICKEAYYKWKTKEVTKDEKLSNVIQFKRYITKLRGYMIIVE